MEGLLLWGSVSLGLTITVFVSVVAFKYWRSLRPGATVFMEKSFSITHPIALSGRPDWVRRHKDKKSLVVYDFKKRNISKAFRSDVIQLSVYGYMLRKKGYQVWEQGVVRCIGQNGQTNDVKVKLLSDEQVEALYERYHQIHQDPGCAQKNAHKALCAHCEHYKIDCSGV